MTREQGEQRREEKEEAVLGRGRGKVKFHLPAFP